MSSPSRVSSTERLISGPAEGSLDAQLARIEEGFDSESVEVLRERLGLSTEQMAELLGISARTLSRRMQAGRLSPGESNRLYRYARLFGRAVEVLGGEETARQWLTTGQWALGGRVPLEIARYEPGAREIRQLLGRIERGIPT